MRIDLRKAGSFRVGLGAFLGALIVAAVLGMIWQPLAYVFIPLFVVLWLVMLVDPATVAYCPHCSKRVKIGATACHHCGRDVA